MSVVEISKLRGKSVIRLIGCKVDEARLDLVLRHVHSDRRAVTDRGVSLIDLLHIVEHGELECAVLVSRVDLGIIENDAVRCKRYVPAGNVLQDLNNVAHALLRIGVHIHRRLTDAYVPASNIFVHTDRVVDADLAVAVHVAHYRALQRIVSVRYDIIGSDSLVSGNCRISVLHRNGGGIGKLSRKLGDGHGSRDTRNITAVAVKREDRRCGKLKLARCGLSVARARRENA